MPAKDISYKSIQLNINSRIRVNLNSLGSIKQIADLRATF